VAVFWLFTTNRVEIMPFNNPCITDIADPASFDLTAIILAVKIKK
jgi:hypothetical protein